MGKNTPERQDFIIDNLRVEKDLVDGLRAANQHGEGHQGAGIGHAGKPPLERSYRNWFLDYASYVILDRAVPHIDDGLKPVQRRVLHTLWDMDDGRFHKVANVVGATMRFHPARRRLDRRGAGRPSASAAGSSSRRATTATS